MSISINKLKCIGCGICVLFCPAYAMSISCDTAFQCTVDRDSCNDCLICIDCCPADAVEEA